MADIVITEFMDEEAVADLSTEFTVTYDETLCERLPELTRLAADCRALIVRNRTRVTEDLLKAARSLRVLGRLGVGLENIDQDACRRHDVPVVAAIGANESTVAEYVVGAMLTLLRRGTFQRTAEVLAGEWPRQISKGIDARGKTIGLIGFGRTAREVARIAAVLGMEVIASSRGVAADDPAWRQLGVERCALDELLARGDIVSLHVAMTPDRRHLIDASALSRMKPGAFLINTARGGLVDEGALADALRGGRLAGAALDVFESEPLPADSLLADAPNLLLTPHVAGYSDEANRRQGQIVARGVRRVLRELEGGQ